MSTLPDSSPQTQAPSYQNNRGIWIHPQPEEIVESNQDTRPAFKPGQYEHDLKEIRITKALAVRQEKIDVVRDAGESIRYTKRQHPKKVNGKWKKGKRGQAVDPKGRRLYTCGSKDSRHQHDLAMWRWFGMWGPVADRLQRTRNHKIFWSEQRGQSKRSLGRQYNLCPKHIRNICEQEYDRWIRKALEEVEVTNPKRQPSPDDRVNLYTEWYAWAYDHVPLFSDEYGDRFHDEAFIEHYADTVARQRVHQDLQHWNPPKVPSTYKSRGTAYKKSSSRKKKSGGKNPAASFFKRKNFWKAFHDRGGVHLPGRKKKKSEHQHVPRLSWTLKGARDVRDRDDTFLADPW